MAAQSTLLYAAVATNVVLGVALFYVITRDRRSKAFRSPRPRPTGAAGMDGASSFFLGDSERLLRDDRLRSRSLSLLLLRLRLRRRRERDGIVACTQLCALRALVCTARVAQV